MRVCRTRVVLVLAIALCAMSTTSSCAREERGAAMGNANPKEQAEKLANSYGKSLGARYMPFDKRNFVSFGEVSFRYDPAKSSVVGFVFVMPVTMEDPTPKQIAYRASFVSSLNDPEIGGMFENAGAIWVVDWWVQVADIKDGVMPKPTRRITRADRR
jgi:hypothetical protein